jgi:hypothetical protein
MNSFPKADHASLVSFYGNPDQNGDGTVDPDWFKENIIYVFPPFPMIWSWGPECRRIAIHRRCAESLIEILSVIGEEFSEAEKIKYQLNVCGGAYNFRTIRGSSTRLSLHAFGAAIDLAPKLNGLGKKYVANSDMMPDRAVRAFTNAGWYWGGSFTARPDAMHFQATEGA